MLCIAAAAVLFKRFFFTLVPRTLKATREEDKEKTEDYTYLFF